MNMDDRAIEILMELEQDMGEVKAKVNMILDIEKRVAAIEVRERATSRLVGMIAGISAMVGAAFNYAVAHWF